MTFDDPVGEARRRDVLYERATRAQAMRLSEAYEEHEFDIPGLTAAESIKTVVNHATNCSCQRASGPFAIVRLVSRAAIRNLAVGPVQVRFGAADADPVTIDDGETLDWDFAEFADLFLTNDSALPRLVRISLG